jgi:hypothetical protein
VGNHLGESVRLCAQQAQPIVHRRVRPSLPDPAAASSTFSAIDWVSQEAPPFHHQRTRQGLLTFS